MGGNCGRTIILKNLISNSCLGRLSTISKYIRSLSCLLSPKTLNSERSTQNSDRQLNSGKRSIFTLRVSDTHYKKKAEFSEKSDSLVTHSDSDSNSLLAAVEILVQPFHFSWATCTQHVSFRGNLLICTVYAQDPGLTPCLSPIQDTPPYFLVAVLILNSVLCFFRAERLEAFYWSYTYHCDLLLGCPGGSDGKESTSNEGGTGFDPWIGV